MARPKKEGLDYFPFDVHLDMKFELVEARFGMVGFGVLVKLLQTIYGESGYYCDWSEDIMLLFLKKHNLIEHKQTVSDIIQMSFDKEIFDRGMYEKYKVLTSQDIQMRYFGAIIRRKPTIRKELLLISIQKTKEILENDENVGDSEKVDDRVNVTEMVADIIDEGVNVDINATKKRKEKERKEKENKEKKMKEDERKQSSVGEIKVSITLKDGSLYHIRDSDISRYSNLYSQLDILQNLKNMVGWFGSNLDKRRNKDEIENFINAWFRRELKSPPPTPQTTTTAFLSSNNYKYFTNDDYDYDEADKEKYPLLCIFDE